MLYNNIMFSSMFECLNYIICKVTMNNIMKKNENNEKKNEKDYIKEYEYIDIDYEKNVIQR